MRIFAGPNGSGKSTLVKLVERFKVDLGIFINADDIKISLNSNRFLDFTAYQLILDGEDLKADFENSPLFIQSDGYSLLPRLQFKDNRLLILNQVTVNDYFTSFLSSYLRTQLLTACNKFTFETVMSHPSKLEFIQQAKERGYRIYLYFIALDNPALCVARVEARVKQEGHDVPPQKVIDRYERTMNLLLDAIRIADRAYVFDNSYSEPKMFAIANNKEISIVNTEFAPSWFQKYVIDKL
ncbi:MAG TPA: zeta toxin family protein [Prolixibacteraceae bacterium]